MASNLANFEEEAGGEVKSWILLDKCNLQRLADQPHGASQFAKIQSPDPDLSPSFATMLRNGRFQPSIPDHPHARY